MLRQLWWRIASIYILLLGVFLSVHYLLTLRTLPACLLTPRVIFFLIPRLSIFAFPLAIGAGVGMLVDWLYLTDQHMLFVSLSSLRRQWWRLLAMVSLSAGLVYFAICGWLSPHCYRLAKQEMIAQTTTLLEKLPTGQLHTLGSQCQIGWEQMRKEKGQAVLCGMRLVVQRPGSPVQLVSARAAELHESGLLLRDGGVVQAQDKMRKRLKNKKEKIIRHTFGSLWLSYDWSGVRSESGKKSIPPRLQTLPAVWRNEDKTSRHEVGLRLASGIWMWWLPFMLVALLPRGGRRRGSAAWAAYGIATGLFCLLYVMATVTGVVWQHSLLWGMVLLAVPIAIGVFGFFFSCVRV